jgi:hypothetical protein
VLCAAAGPSAEGRSLCFVVETATTIELSPEELREMLELRVRERREVSLDELLRAYDSGELEDTGDVADLLVLADLLPERQYVLA